MFFGYYGTRYIIGEDEISVIIHSCVDINILVKNFTEALVKLRQHDLKIPTLSVGCCVVNQGENGLNIFCIADQNINMNKSNGKKLV